ncbi:MAG: OsmC family protein [Acidobacteria bacterium]|nr:OsmC family protein [Acidobacteriota bacterium]
MEIAVNFPGGARVDARFGSFTVSTDQSVALGGEESAPAPFDLFLASLATCAGAYVQGFCKMRGISTKDIKLIQKVERDPKTRMISKVFLDIQLPEDFPQHYVPAVIRAAESCLVKKHLGTIAAFEASTSIAQTLPT